MVSVRKKGARVAGPLARGFQTYTRSVPGAVPSTRDEPKPVTGRAADELLKGDESENTGARADRLFFYGLEAHAFTARQRYLRVTPAHPSTVRKRTTPAFPLGR